MDAAKRKGLEAAGWKLGDAAEFLEMSDEERQLLDTRVERPKQLKPTKHSLGAPGEVTFGKEKLTQ